MFITEQILQTALTFFYKIILYILLFVWNIFMMITSYHTTFIRSKLYLNFNNTTVDADDDINATVLSSWTFLKNVQLIFFQVSVFFFFFIFLL